MITNIDKYKCSMCMQVLQEKLHYEKDNNKKKIYLNNDDNIKFINQIKNELNIDYNITRQPTHNMNHSEIETTNNFENKCIIQEKGLHRNIIDKYYTKTHIVKQCIEKIKTYLKISKDDLIIEPSAGNGAFIEDIKLITNNYLFYDLEPENNEIIKQDFLNFDFTKININNRSFKNIHIIGNPPFGRQASLAIKFIKKCCLFSNSISFILPKSFKKNSMKQHFSKNFHLIYEIDLSDNSFLVNNIESNVPCIFQIWQYKNEIRPIIIKVKPVHFKFVNKDDNPDISFRRVGVNAGSIMRDIKDKSTQSHYFIKFINNDTIEQNIEKLKLIYFEFNNTVGPKSISKPELINEFNKLLI